LNKKKILLIVRRTSGEIDWVLPLLYKLKEKYEIITVFEAQYIFSDLKRNKQLYKLWEAINKKTYVKSFYDNFLLRLFLVIIIKINKYFNFYLINLEKLIYKKIFVNKIVQNKLGIKNHDDIKFLFHDSGGFTGWLAAFKKINTKIIFYPHSTVQYSKIYDRAKNLQGELVIVGTSKEKKLWQKFFSGNVIASGHLKFSQNWLKKFKLNKKNIKKKTIIVLPMKDWMDKYEKNKLRLIINDVFEILNKNSDKIILYIKLSKKNYYSNYFFLKSLLYRYKFSYSFKKESLLSLAKISNLFLVFNDSATAFDAVANKIIPIELWNKVPNLSCTKKYTFQVNNKSDFENIIHKHFDNKLNKDFKKKYKLFSKEYLSKINYREILNFFS